MQLNEERKEHQDCMQTLPAEHIRKRNQGGTFRLLGDEQHLEGSNVTYSESGRVTTMETLKMGRCVGIAESTEQRFHGDRQQRVFIV